MSEPQPRRSHIWKHFTMFTRTRTKPDGEEVTELYAYKTLENPCQGTTLFVNHIHWRHPQFVQGQNRIPIWTWKYELLKKNLYVRISQHINLILIKLVPSAIRQTYF